jgi:hypothetical protein
MGWSVQRETDSNNSIDVPEMKMSEIWTNECGAWDVAATRNFRSQSTSMIRGCGLAKNEAARPQAAAKDNHRPGIALFPVT